MNGAETQSPRTLHRRTVSQQHSFENYSPTSSRRTSRSSSVHQPEHGQVSSPHRRAISVSNFQFDPTASLQSREPSQSSATYLHQTPPQQQEPSIPETLEAPSIAVLEKLVKNAIDDIEAINKNLLNSLSDSIISMWKGSKQTETFDKITELFALNDESNVNAQWALLEQMDILSFEIIESNVKEMEVDFKTVQDVASVVSKALEAVKDLGGNAAWQRRMKQLESEGLLVKAGNAFDTETTSSSLAAPTSLHRTSSSGDFDVRRYSTENFEEGDSSSSSITPRADQQGPLMVGNRPIYHDYEDDSSDEDEDGLEAMEQIEVIHREPNVLSVPQQQQQSKISPRNPVPTQLKISPRKQLPPQQLKPNIQQLGQQIKKSHNGSPTHQRSQSQPHQQQQQQTQNSGIFNAVKGFFINAVTGGNSSPDARKLARSPSNVNINATAIPMTKQELDKAFASIVVESGYGKDRIDSMMLTFSDKQKYEMIQSYHKTRVLDRKYYNEIQQFIQLEECTLQHLRSICIILQTRGSKLVEYFLDQHGLDKLTNILGKTNYLGRRRSDYDRQLQHEICLILKAICSTDKGINIFIERQASISTAIMLLDSDEVKTRSIIIYIFALCCMVNSHGFKVILEAFEHYKFVRREPQVFANFVNSIGQYQHDQEYLQNSLMLINALLNSATDASQRLRLQKIFIDLGLPMILKAIVSSSQRSGGVVLHEDLQIQIEVFNQELGDYDSYYSQKLAELDDPGQLANLLVQKLNEAQAMQHSTSILQCLYMAADATLQAWKAHQQGDPGAKQLYELVLNNWQTLDTMVRKTVLDFGKKQVRALTTAEILLQDTIATQQQTINALESREASQKQYFADYLTTFLKAYQSGSVDSLLRNASRQPDENNGEELLKVMNKVFSQMNDSGFKQGIDQQKEMLEYQSKINILNRKVALLKEGKSIEEIEKQEQEEEEAKRRKLLEEEEKKRQKEQQQNELVPPPPPPPPSVPDAPPAPGIPAPPGGAIAGLPTVKVKRPKNATKQLFWSDIPKLKVKETIFVKKNVIQQSNNINLDFDKLEQLFSNEKIVKEDNASTKPNQQQVVKEELISLIDSKRSYNVSIILKTIKIPLENVREAIIKMDERVMPREMIEVICSIAPTQEEVDTVSQFTGAVEKLAEPERFFYLLKDIPNVLSVLSTWKTKTVFWNVTAMLRPELDSLIKACKEVSSNDALQQLLGILLAMGNFLNSGKKRVAYGFQLSSTLPKLKDTKSQDNKSNLLDFLVESICEREDWNHLLKLQEQLPWMEKASRVDMQRIRDDWKELNDGIEAVRKQIRLQTDNESVLTQSYLQVMKAFEIRATFEMDQIKEKLEVMNKELVVLANLFGEDETQLQQQPSAFFLQLSEFFKQCKESHHRFVKKQEALHKKRQKEQLLLQQQQQLLELQLLREQSMFVSHDLLGEPVTEAPASKTILKLERRMKTGSIFKKRRDSRGQPELPMLDSLKKRQSVPRRRITVLESQEMLDEERDARRAKENKRVQLNDTTIPPTLVVSPSMDIPPRSKREVPSLLPTRRRNKLEDNIMNSSSAEDMTSLSSSTPQYERDYSLENLKEGFTSSSESESSDYD